MKARKLIVLSVAAGGLLLAGCSVPTTAAPAPVENHLYSAEAGFARSSSITVQSVADPGLAVAVAWWNTEAGRQLFTLGTTGHLQVTVQPDNRTCADGPTVACTAAFPTSGAFVSPPTYPYSSCAIYVKVPGATDWRVYAHELGHCLGFEHVTQRTSIMNPAADAGNAAADQSMLQLAGY